LGALFTKGLQPDSPLHHDRMTPEMERAHPMLIPLAAALGLTEEQVDQAFREAINI
jgi:hypothetical protein